MVRKTLKYEEELRVDLEEGLGKEPEERSFIETLRKDRQ